MLSKLNNCCILENLKQVGIGGANCGCGSCCSRKCCALSVGPVHLLLQLSGLILFIYWQCWLFSSSSCGWTWNLNNDSGFYYAYWICWTIAIFNSSLGLAFIGSSERTGLILAYFNMFIVFLMGSLQLIHQMIRGVSWPDANTYMYTVAGLNLTDGFIYFLEIAISFCQRPSGPTNIVYPVGPIPQTQVVTQAVPVYGSYPVQTSYINGIHYGEPRTIYYSDRKHSISSGSSFTA